MKTTTTAYKQGMLQPFRRRSHLRILWNKTGTPQSWTDDDIVTATITREVDPLARSLPTENISFGIIDYNDDYNPSNPTGKWDEMDEGTEIHVQFGFEDSGGTTEWLDYDVFFIDGKPSYAKNIATFRASSMLSQLNKTTFYKAYAGNTVSLWNIAQAVCIDAGLSALEYDIDASLSSMTGAIAFPLASHAAILQMIAHAAGCAIYTVGRKVTIKPIDITALTYHQNALTGRDIVLGSHQSDRSAPLGKVLVKSKRFMLDASTTQVALYQATVSGTVKIHVEYPMSGGVSASVVGGTIISQDCYACASDVTVSGGGTVTLQFNGRKVSENESIYEYVASNNADYATDTEDLKISDRSGSELANKVIAYFGNRVSDSFSYRGDPSIEPMDGIYLETRDGLYPAIVVKHTITYNGALAGKMTVRRVRNTQALGMLLDSQMVNVIDSNGDQVYVRSYAYYVSAYTEAQMDAFCTTVLGH